VASRTRLAYEKHVERTIAAVEQLPKATIALIRGVAAGGGASNGGAAISGSFIIQILSIDTQATLGKGTRVNQAIGLGGAGQSLTVKATDSITLLDFAGALSLSKSSVAIGLTVIVDVVNINVAARVGDGALVTAGGTVTVDSGSVETMTEVSVAGGASASSSAVTGAVVVVVLNQGGSSPKVSAAIGTGAGVSGAGGVAVTASKTGTVDLAAGNLAIGGGGAGVGASAVVVVRDSAVEATVGAGSPIQAGGTGLLVSATQDASYLFLAVGGAGGDSAGVAGSVVVNVTSDTTFAHVDAGSAVTQGTSTAVLAKDTTTLLSLAGVLTVGGTAGVGVGIDVEVLTKDTEAWIGHGAIFTGSGNLSVDAASSEKLTSISVGGGFAGTAAVNVNAAVPTITVTTKANLEDGASAADGVRAAMGGTVRVSADEALTLNVIAGNISAAGTAAVGAAVAIPVVTKETHAWIGNYAVVSGAGAGGLDVASGSYTVTPHDPRFAPGDVSGGNTIHVDAHGFADGDQVQYDAGYGTAISPLTQGGQYFVKVIDANHFQLFSAPDLSGSAIVLTGGTGESHRLFKTNEANVTQDGTPRFNPENAVDLVGNRIRLPYSPGAISNNDAVVYSSGGGTPIGGLVDGGTYYYKDLGGGWFQLLDKPSDKGGVVIALGSGWTGRSHSLVREGDAPAGDASAMGPRDIAQGTTPGFRGVAVTATNSDSIGAFGIGLGFSGTATVTIAGAIAVVTVHTSAHIGANARINCGATCASNVAGADTGQSVQVSAANQFYQLGIAFTLAIGGSAGVSIPVAVRVVTLDTYAYIGTGTAVNARNSISVTADGKDTVLSFALGAGGGTVGVAGTVAVTVLTVHTFACTGTPGGPDPFACTGNGAALSAGNNVVVVATDATRLLLITVALAGGYVGIGAAVGVATLDKQVRAYLGAGSVVDALALGAPVPGVPDGTLRGTQSFSGVIVHAGSSEDVFGLVPAIGGGFVGVAGGVQVTLPDNVHRRLDRRLQLGQHGRDRRCRGIDDAGGECHGDGRLQVPHDRRGCRGRVRRGLGRRRRRDSQQLRPGPHRRPVNCQRARQRGGLRALVQGSQHFRRQPFHRRRRRGRLGVRMDRRDDPHLDLPGQQRRKLP